MIRYFLKSRLLFLLAFTSCKMGAEYGEDIHMNEADRQFMSTVTAYNLSGADIAQQCVSRAADTAVKSLGDRVGNDVSRVQQQLAILASIRSYDLPRTGTAALQQRGSALAAAGEITFDSIFIYTLKTHCSEVIQCCERELQQGNDKDILAYAGVQLDLTRDHQVRADSIAAAFFP